MSYREFDFSAQSNFDLKDYKFFCFYGKVGFVYLMENYANHHELGRLGFLTVEMAKILSSDFPHVRVDFYNVDGKIIFGELTFFTASGYMQFEPDGFDFEIGSVMKLKSYGAKNI